MKLSEPRVFVTNDTSGLDYSPAARYGRLVLVTRGAINVYSPQRSLDHIAAKLEAFTERDYLLISGNNVAGVLCLATLCRRIDVLKLLVFDAKHNEYRPHTLDLGALQFLVDGRAVDDDTDRAPAGIPERDTSGLS